MRPNINDLPKLQELKRTLAEKNVSDTAISTIEKALRKGMIFKRPEDLSILSIPTVDLNMVGELVDFNTPTNVVKNLKRIEYQFIPVGDKKFFFGYQLIVSFINNDRFTIEQSFPIEDSGIVIVDLDLNELLPNSKVLLKVKSAQGEYVGIAFQPTTEPPVEEFIEVNISALANEKIHVAIEKLPQVPNPSVKGSYQVKGKLISNKSIDKLDGYQVVIFASTTDNAEDLQPVAFASTESNGYFVTGFISFFNIEDQFNVKLCRATVSKQNFRKDIQVRTKQFTEGSGENAVSKSMIPDRLILVIDEEISAEEGCTDCGCNNLNFHEKKVVEEFSYYSVVRTTEPSIIADILEEEKEINLKDLYGVNITVPFSVFQKFHLITSKQIKSSNIIKTNVAALTNGNGNGSTITKINPEIKANFNQDLLDKLVLDHKVKTIIRGNEKPVFKGRTVLSQMNQIDWDDDPTIYQAASIAHGHLLHFKQEWIPDGYSIGDLVYSLPLAPGQKKQIAVLDWERRESAARSQELSYEETLNNTLIRDRDISEVVSATLSENIKGNSSASTSSFGAGFGAGIMGILPGGAAFGSLLGISGGKSKASSNASQSSNRQSTANSLQSISDRTMQAASMVRSQRATVIQTVSQGETVSATAESVANYNHCHAITIQYFEVLRHFEIRNRLAGVQECLFIPLQMSPFDINKCLRWRNTLERYLFKPSLRAAFDAIARIQNEKESAFENYYDSIGFPRVNFAEQNVVSYDGELLIEFTFFNTNEGKVDAAMLEFFKIFGLQLNDYLDKQISNDELARVVGPRTIEFLLDHFTVTTDKGKNLAMDFTLVNTFRPNIPLRITMRQSAQTPTDIPREQIGSLLINLDLSNAAPELKTKLEQLQNKYMKVRVHSGNLRYRTNNIAGTLFSGRIDNDIFAGSDGVFLTTPLTRNELRNPRGEDVDAANNLLQHLNENMEYYHKCIYFDMTPERRYMLLDGIIAPGKANGRSVASVVENRVIGIAGNCLIMPVAPGNQLDPTIDDEFDLFAQYHVDQPEPMRVSMPTKGIYAEAVMGQCNSCEEKDESRFWRWEESPIPDSPNTQILPLNTDTRRAEPGNLDPKDFPAPVVNIQNAPTLPDPTGLQSMLQLVGKGDAFRDITGLNQNQLNAIEAFKKSMDTAQAFGKEAAEMAKAAAANKLIEDAKKNGSVSNDKAKELTEKNIKASIPKTKEELMDLAKKQLDMISQLETSGGLPSEAAQNARKNIIETLTKGLDGNSTSAGDLGSLMEKASQTGTNVKKDGDGFEITKGDGQTKPLIVDLKLSPSLKAFNPPSDRSGKTILSVKPSNAPAGSTLKWSIPDDEAGKYSITQKMNGEANEVTILGIQPGIAAIDIELLDGTNKIASEKHKLSIPQFIEVSFAAEFDTFLNGIQSSHLKDPIIEEIVNTVQHLTKDSNIRLVWKHKGHTSPAHVPANMITKVTVRNTDGFVESDGSVRNLFGGFVEADGNQTNGNLIGAHHFNESISVFAGTYLIDDSTVDYLDGIGLVTKGIIHELILARVSDPVIDSWVVKIFGRLIGETMSHEIFHSLLDESFAHNPVPPAVAALSDIMNDGSNRDFTQRTGIKVHALASPIFNQLTDNGITAIVGLKGSNRNALDGFYPVPPAVF